jgi:uncharacterized protein YbjT (DUF2867 family)
MVGQGLLREALRDPDIVQIVLVGRSPATLPVPDPGGKVVQYRVSDPGELAPLERELRGIDACFWCLGVTVAGLSEAEYRRITRDLAVRAAESLLAWNPDLTFVFVSGAGADSSGKGKVMWARVKGEAERAILALPFRAAYAIRPAFIQPLHGIVSRTRLYRFFYALSGPIFPLLRLLAPGYVTTTERLGRAMLAVARTKPTPRTLEQRDLNALA